MDLVEQMIRVAAGEPLSFTQDDLKIDGWAIESRLYAEDPYRGFLPSIGPPRSATAPRPTWRMGDAKVRNDTGVREGDEISMFYDPMIAKLCTWGPTREAAVDGMGLALESLEIEGLGHNAPFLSAVMDQERFRSGKLSTAYIKDEFPEGFHGLEPDAFQRELMVSVAVYMQRLQHARSAGKPRTEWIVDIGGDKRTVTVAGGESDLTLLVDGRDLKLKGVEWRPGQALFKGVLDERPFSATVRPAAEGFDIRHRAARARVLVLTPLSAELHAKLPKRQAADTSKTIVSPMPGLVISLDVTVGQEVKTGQTGRGDRGHEDAEHPQGGAGRRREGDRPKGRRQRRGGRDCWSSSRDWRTAAADHWPLRHHRLPLQRRGDAAGAPPICSASSRRGCC